MISFAVLIGLVVTLAIGTTANVFLGITWLWVVIGFAYLYLVLGVISTIVLAQTPYGDNGYAFMTLLWPLFWWGILLG
jgi:hypothetical protein